MTAPQPFTVEVPQRVLDGIREKVRAYEWPRTPSIAPDEDPWTYGTDPAWLWGPSQMSMGRCLSPRPVSAGGEQGA